MRLATPQDGVALAELVNYAGEGLPLYLWRSLAGPGEDPWAIGAARQARQAEAGNVIVVEQGASVVAAMVGHPLDELPPAEDSLPAILRPIRELERKVPRTWYLNVLATYPRARGKGLGSRLLEVAEADAAARGLSGVSIICADANVGAHRLYQRLGYHEIARAPMVKSGWESPSEAWILLIKETPS
jgi:ribosomal protein S18 acetylase RimI-like enzyme